MGCPISDGRLLNLAYDTNEHHPKKPHLCSAADSADDDRMLGRATTESLRQPTHQYHSDRLGFDINYPSFLYRQELPDDAGMQELFMMDDISVSFMVDSLHNVLRTSGQTLLAMGADLVDVGDDYSIHDGQDDKWEYYSKVINSDTLRQVTIILRYYPEHAEAMEPLKEWVRDFQITP